MSARFWKKIIINVNIFIKPNIDKISTLRFWNSGMNNWGFVTFQRVEFLWFCDRIKNSIRLSIQGAWNEKNEDLWCNDTVNTEKKSKKSRRSIHPKKKKKQWKTNLSFIWRVKIVARIFDENKDIKKRRWMAPLAGE